MRKKTGKLVQYFENLTKNNLVGTQNNYPNVEKTHIPFYKLQHGCSDRGLENFGYYRKKTESGEPC